MDEEDEEEDGEETSACGQALGAVFAPTSTTRTRLFSAHARTHTCAIVARRRGSEAQRVLLHKRDGKRR